MLNMIFPSDDQIRRIFGTMLTHKMLDFPDEARTKCDSITDASIELFKVSCMRADVLACMRTCVRACVHAYVRACVFVFMCEC